MSNTDPSSEPQKSFSIDPRTSISWYLQGAFIDVPIRHYLQHLIAAAVGLYFTRVIVDIPIVWWDIPLFLIFTFLPDTRPIAKYLHNFLALFISVFLFWQAITAYRHVTVDITAAILFHLAFDLWYYVYHLRQIDSWIRPFKLLLSYFR